MGIARFENLDINNVINGVDDFGQYTTTLTKWYTTRATVQDVKNGLSITKDDRVYTDLARFIMSYTPNTKRICINQNLYAINYRGQDWRITDAIESNDRMTVTLLCYRNDPSTPV